MEGLFWWWPVGLYCQPQVLDLGLTIITNGQFSPEFTACRRSGITRGSIISPMWFYKVTEQVWHKKRCNRNSLISSGPHISLRTSDVTSGPPMPGVWAQLAEAGTSGSSGNVYLGPGRGCPGPEPGLWWPQWGEKRRSIIYYLYLNVFSLKVKRLCFNC